MKSELLLVAVILLSATHSASGWNYGCDGGGGPTPLIDISTRIKTKLDVIKTRGGVREFLLQRGDKELVYRNDRGMVYSTKLEDGDTETLFKAHRPLARVADPRGRFFLAEGTGWLFDTLVMRWVRLLLPKARSQPLFWQGQALFSLRRVELGDGFSSFKIFRYDVGTSRAVQACPALELSDDTRLAQGNSYPYLLFYRSRRALVGSTLHRTIVDVETCKAKDLGASEYLVPGKVLSAHWFADTQSLAVEVEHPTHKLLWEHGGACEYFNPGPGRVFVPNDRRALLAHTSASGELTLIRPDRRVKATVLQAGSYSLIDAKSIRINDDMTQLFISPQMEPRPLLRLGLSGLTD